MVTAFVMEKNFLWLRVYHNRQINCRNQSFPICKRNQISNTKGSWVVPYSRWLNKIPVEIFPILLAFSNSLSTTINKESVLYNMLLYLL